MNIESAFRGKGPEAQPFVPLFETGSDARGQLSLPDGQQLEISNVVFKGPIEQGTYSGTTEDGREIRVATEERDGAIIVVGVWIDEAVAYQEPTLH